MTTKYDPRKLQSYAERLYRQAWLVILRDSLVGFLIGFALDFTLPPLFPRLLPRFDPAAPNALILPLACLIPAYLFGSSQAFRLRLEAQHILCEAQIERDLQWLANKLEMLPLSIRPESRRVVDAVGIAAPPAPADASKVAQAAAFVGEQPIGNPRTGDVFGLS